MIQKGVLEEVSNSFARCYTKHYGVPKPGSSEKRIVGNFVGLNKEGAPLPMGLQATTVFSDASNSSLCILVDKKRHVFKHSIPASASSAYKEGAAIVKGLETIDLPDNCIWYNDNAATVTAFSKGYSPSKELNGLIQEVLPILKKKHIEFRFISGANNPADHGSRPDLSAAQAKAKATYAEVARRTRSKRIADSRLKFAAAAAG